MNEIELNIYSENLKKQFDQSVDSIDAQTLSRITQIRYTVLSELNNKSGWGIWTPAGAIATACLALVIYSLVPQQQVENKAIIEEIEIISEQDLYENLEFYAWFEQHELPT